MVSEQLPFATVIQGVHRPLNFCAKRQILLLKVIPHPGSKFAEAESKAVLDFMQRLRLHLLNSPSMQARNADKAKALLFGQQLSQIATSSLSSALQSCACTVQEARHQRHKWVASTCNTLLGACCQLQSHVITSHTWRAQRHLQQ